jgi:hypothetical protein
MQDLSTGGNPNPNPDHSQRQKVSRMYPPLLLLMSFLCLLRWCCWPCWLYASYQVANGARLSGFVSPEYISRLAQHFDMLHFTRMWEEVNANDLRWLVQIWYIILLFSRLMYNSATTLYMMLEWFQGFQKPILSLYTSDSVVGYADTDFSTLTDIVENPNNMKQMMQCFWLWESISVVVARVLTTV